MNEPLKPSERNFYNPNELLEEGVVKDLVSKGRVPMFVEFQSSEPFDKTSVSRRSLMIVPPVGTTRGSGFELTSGTYSYEFYSPDGEELGIASLHVISPDLRSEIEARVEQEKKRYDLRQRLRKLFLFSVPVNR